MHLHLDFETFSRVDIKKVGAYRYAFDPSTEILCAAMALGDEEPVCYAPDEGDPFEQWTIPDRIWDAIEDPAVLIYAHNAMFEMAICQALLQKTWGIPCPDLSRFRCTASLARRAALPAKLETLAITLGLKHLKDTRGSQLIRKFSIMQKAKTKPTKKNPQGVAEHRIRPQDDPAAFLEFCNYCQQDVRVEQEVAKKLAYFDEPINNANYSLDARINARGVPVNLDGLRKAQVIIDEESELVAARFRELTGFNFTQGTVFLEWLQKQNYKIEDLQAQTVEDFLAEWDVPPWDMTPAVQALKMKQSVAYAAIKKVGSMLACAGPHDNRIRGMLIHHGATTGRWSASLVQFMNMKRPTIKHSEEAYREICDGMSRGMLDCCYGSPLEVISSCIRHFVHDAGDCPECGGLGDCGACDGDGRAERQLLDADYAAIEARIICWLAGQEDALDEYRNGVDRYRRMASLIYGIPADEVNKHPQRFVGKQAVLGCIARGQLVLTDHGLIPIEEVLCWHRVWDGVGWVSHEGVIYKGRQKVISYQGLTATPDHIVFVRDSLGFERTTDLRSAREQKLGIILSAEGGTPLRTMDCPQQSGFSENRPKIDEGSMRMWNSHVSGLSKSSYGEKSGMRSLCAQRQHNLLRTHLAAAKVRCSTSKMHKPQELTLPPLRWSGNRISVRNSVVGSQLGDGQFRAPQEVGIGPNQQRGSLRTRQSPLCNSQAAGLEHSNPQNGLCVQGRGVALHQTSGGKILEDGYEQGADFRTSFLSHQSEAQTLESDLGESDVFDVINAGPRHRFTVSGRLVHNCGFQMSAPKFRVTCKNMGNYDLPKDLEFKAVDAFRKAHPMIVQYWRDLDTAAKKAIVNKGQLQKVRNVQFLCKNIEGLPFLLLKLPSGRKLAYPRPRVGPSKKFENAKAIYFYGNIKGTTWGEVDTWGSKFSENITQAVAADIMVNGAHNAEAKGYQIATLVHDQALAYCDPEKKEQSVEEFVELLTKLPQWAAGLPIAAEGGLIPFYKKD